MCITNLAYLCVGVDVGSNVGVDVEVCVFIDSDKVVDDIFDVDHELGVGAAVALGSAARFGCARGVGVGIDVDTVACVDIDTVMANVMGVDMGMGRERAQGQCDRSVIARSNAYLNA